MYFSVTEVSKTVYPQQERFEFEFPLGHAFIHGIYTKFPSLPSKLTHV